ncbi:glycosyltransferase [Nostocoides sp. F2B08]|uniref:glycosyltransferase family 2 protein n=1 Tax=Nostocoides sp. F2B08 TaxID=2653936 RepID=UPI0012638B67|nr:glycosyltransferase [Tetrasphaera sp. F2B08]
MARIVCGVINYNYADFLKECLQSIDEQVEVDDIRVIVVDDCSTDNSREIIEQWARSSPHQTEIVFKSVNTGPGDSYNQIIRRLRPEDEFLAIIDADDYWLPRKSIAQLAAFGQSPPTTAVVYSDDLVLDNETGVLEARRVQSPPIGQGAIEHLLTRHVFTPLNSTLIRAEMVSEIDASLRVCDLQLWLATAKRGEFVYCPGHYSVTRRHKGSMSLNETLRTDRLTILGRYASNGQERSWARQRGRSILKASSIDGPQPPVKAYISYIFRLHDVKAIAFLVARLIPGNQSILRRLYHYLRR